MRLNHTYDAENKRHELRFDTNYTSINTGIIISSFLATERYHIDDRIYLYGFNGNNDLTIETRNGIDIQENIFKAEQTVLCTIDISRGTILLDTSGVINPFKLVTMDEWNALVKAKKVDTSKYYAIYEK